MLWGLIAFVFAVACILFGVAIRRNIDGAVSLVGTLMLFVAVITTVFQLA